MERRLSAILAADVVGYSALMEQDEAGTFDRLRAHRKELFEPEIDKHHGRIFKLTGDGLFAEFSSVVDAVECAASLQRGLAERNANVPEDQRIDVRIGINLGEVIVEGDDRLGEGVNIAARLEQLAEPGGICVSGKVAKEVEKKLAFAFEPMGEQKVKNIVEPVSVYRVKLEHVPVRRLAKPPQSARNWASVSAGLALLLLAGAGTWLWQQQTRITPNRTSGPPTLAVLPLANMSGDPNLQYLADGTTENLIANLARSPQIKVVSRTTTDAYKGKSMDVRQIGRETGADFVLEGSIQKSGDTMRIVGQLIDAATGKHVWSDRFDGQSKDVLALQDDVTGRILAALAGDSGKIKKAEYEKAWGKDSGDLGEYDFYLRGHQVFMQGTPAGIEEGIKIWSQGLEEYPASALLKIKLAYGYFMRVLIGSSPDAANDCEKAYNLGQEGLGKRDAGPLAIGVGHMLMAEVQLVCRKDYDKALSEYETTLQMMPNDWIAIAGLAYVPIAAGKPDLAIKELSRLTKQDTLAEWGFAYLSWAHFAKAEYEKAIEAAKQAPIPVPTVSIPMLIASYAELGRMEEAKAQVAELLKALPNASIKVIRDVRAVRDQEILEREIAALRKAGVPEG